MIEIKNITQYFGDHAALKNVSLNVDRGTCLVLMGPSGSGKTSLLRLIAGLDRPSSGEIVMSGKTISTPGNVAGPEQRRMSMIFQSLALWPHMTAVEHLVFVMAGTAGVGGRQKVRENAMQLLDRIRLADRSSRFPHQLSGGEKQRLAIARALASGPDCLLMDEPFSNLDELLRDELLTMTLQEKQDRSMTVIYVTHNVDEALQMADKLAVLHHGEIQEMFSDKGLCGLSRRDILKHFTGGGT